MTDQTQREERRSDDRRPFAAQAFALSDSRDADVLVADISYKGCQLRTDLAFTPGERVELLIRRRGVIAAEICWATNDRAGAKFLD